VSHRRVYRKGKFPSDRDKADDLGLNTHELRLLELIARGDDGRSIRARLRLSREEVCLAGLRIQVKTGTRSVREMEEFARRHGV